VEVFLERCAGLEGHQASVARRVLTGASRTCRAAPGNHESAGKPKGAGTRRGNVLLKPALFAAASAAVRTKGSHDRDKHNRPRARRGPARATRATAHTLLTAALHRLGTGEAFRDLGESRLDQAARRRSTAKLAQRPSNLGCDVMLAPKAAQPSSLTIRELFPQQCPRRRATQTPARASSENTPCYAATAFQSSGQTQPETFEAQLDAKRKLFSAPVSLKTH